MSAFAAVALLLVVAAWARPRPAARQQHRTERLTRRRRRTTPPPTIDEWAALLDAVSAEVRTGSSLSAAIGQAVGHCQPHGRVLTPTVTLASIDVAGSTPDANEAVVLHTLRAAHALGGPTAATLDAASALLRERALIRSEATAHSAQARLSARVLTAVPIAFAGWSALSSRTFRAAALSPLGLASTLAGGACNLFGWWWMRRIVEKAVA